MAEPAAAPAEAESDAGTRLPEKLARFFDQQRRRSPLPQFAHSGYALIAVVRDLTAGSR